MKAHFIKSAETLDQIPFWGRPEVAIIGRSNAGKSSFVNALTGQGLAKVSGQPGKTRLLNFFSIDSKWILVDLPGYGYAARSHSERNKWGKIIQDYLENREALRALIVILDCRRDWTEDEQWAKDFAEENGLGFLVLANKMDKLNQKERHQRNVHFKEALDGSPVIFTSAPKKRGIPQVLSYIMQNWLKPVKEDN